MTYAALGNTLEEADSPSNATGFVLPPCGAHTADGTKICGKSDTVLVPSFMHLPAEHGIELC